MGAANPTEAAGVGGVGAGCWRWQAQFSSPAFDVMKSTVPEQHGVPDLIVRRLSRGVPRLRGACRTAVSMPGGVVAAMLIVMLLMFLLGFVLDFIEITFVVVPIVGPILLTMGVDPVWLGVMIAINLQTSFLTPPFGFALFYLRGVAPDNVETTAIYRGVIPFVVIQLVALACSRLPELQPGCLGWLRG